MHELNPKQLNQTVEEAKREALEHQGPKTPKSRFKLINDLRNKLIDTLSRLQIRVKLIIATTAIVVITVTIFSVIILRSGKKLLQEELEEICSLAVRNLSNENVITQLLVLAQSDALVDKSEALGYLYTAVLEVQKFQVHGLKYALIIDRKNLIVAHTESTVGGKVNLTNMESLNSDSRTFIRELSDVLEYIFPIYVTKEGTSVERVPIGAAIIGFSKDEILSPINKITRAIFGVAFFVIVMSVAVIFLFARRITTQIDLLLVGVHKLAAGNLGFTIDVVTHDELGRLAHEFNRMIEQLREKRYMQKFVSQLTLDMIKEKSADEGVKPGGERREVTLLFSDVRNFTALTEELGPEEIVKSINFYLDLQARIVEEHNGIVDKFMGDQIMAIFMGESMADQAVRAAVTIQRSIREQNARRKKKGEVTLTVGCGLNDGQVVMGNMGSQNRLDYTVIGDVVNLASRLCALAKPGQIIAPIRLGERLRGDYPTIRLEPVMVKGRSRPVEIFEIDYDRAIIM